MSILDWFRRTPEEDAGVRVVGAPPPSASDVYHAFLRMPWAVALATISTSYLAVNALFALAYLRAGGIVGARPGSMWDAFCFSVQTMGTIGYGAMYPVSVTANALVIAESVVGLGFTAVATGLVFAKFARTTARVMFTDHVTLTLMDGKPTLMFRVGNERSNAILEAEIRVTLVRTERTREGRTFYRMYDLPLVRHRSSALARSWTVMHVVGPDSPLHEQTAESLAASEAELYVTLVGIDDTSLQPVHARRRYTADRVLFGRRHADILTEDERGDLVLDVRKFHLLEDEDVTPPAA